MAAIVNQCADYFEKDLYMLPQEKHCLLRVMPYGLFLMDGEKDTQYNIFKSKKIKLSRFATIFRVLNFYLFTNGVRNTQLFLCMETCKLHWNL
jgi:cytoplasmic FMR1 interacting protein